MAVAAAMQTPFRLSGKFLVPEVRERIGEGDDGRRPGQVDVWRGIEKPVAAAPYVHPLVRRSSSSMSLESLQMCTESLGSESSSDDFSDSDFGRVEAEGEEERREIEFAEENVEETGESRSTCRRGTELGAAVNYQCASVSRRSPPRRFPPPLTSISRRDGPCLHMVSHRRDGRLVVEAVPVPSRNYLHASREGGRLLLSVVGATANSGDQNEEKKAVEVANSDKEAEVEEAEEATLVEEEDEEEEEVEVVYRGTVVVLVDVKVSTQPQQQSIGTAPKKILRLSLVINKFLGGTPENKTCTYRIQPEIRPLRPTSAVAASGLHHDRRLHRDGNHGEAGAWPPPAGKHAAVHVQAVEPGGDAAQHAPVQPAPAAALLLGALLHCRFLLTSSAAAFNYYYYYYYYAIKLMIVD